MTREEYRKLHRRFLEGKVDKYEAMEVVIDLVFESEVLRGKIHELEELLDGDAREAGYFRE